MKYLEEYRNPELVSNYIKEIKATVTRPWRIMEICGGQTHSLVKNGILDLLPQEITMIHGPGCPVCVTPLALIDEAIFLAEEKSVILCSYGDMLRVPGSDRSLLEAKAKGADIRIVYSPLDAVKIAQKFPEKEVVFFAVGFETTAPANALSVVQSQMLKLTNYSILTSHVLVPPALEAIFNDEETTVDAVLAAGHVCAIMGTSEYAPIVEKYKRPIVVTGFEPVDLLAGILDAVNQLESGKIELENAYKRVVQDKGTPSAISTIFKVFEISDRDWRGIGTIPQSGYQLKKEYAAFDAHLKFKVEIEKVKESEECIAGQILKGIKKPFECPAFGKKCTPENPLGAPMVSSEGACAAYFYVSGGEI
jgi:hydrogenase expression/formation protein HypD